MEFNFDCVQSLGCDENGFAILEGSYQNRIVPGYILFVKEILNSMGEASSQAQKLNTTITSAHKFFISNHRIFIKAEQNKVLGFIKVGTKKLFLRDRNYNYHEVNTLCVLDFYVHESIQRRGVGKQLFDYMLEFEKKLPTELAYDRPSPKLLSFLKKYFGLNDFIQQTNNYVVFDEFFSLISSSKNNITYDNDTNRAIRNLPNLTSDKNIIENNNNNYDNMNNMNNMNNINNMNNMNNMNNNNNQNNINNSLLEIYDKSKQINELFNKLKEQTNKKNEMTKSKKKLGRLPREKEETYYDPFKGYNCPKFALAFTTPAGHTKIINAPVKVKIREILVEYIKKVGLGPDVIQNGIYFLYNGFKLTKVHEDKLVEQVFFNNANIVVFDEKNLIGAKIK